MRQIGILAAGLNCYTPLYLTHISAKHFYYASTVAVYIYDVHTFSLLDVITVGENTITSFDLSPVDENILLIGCVNGYACYYDMQKQKVVDSTDMPPSRTAIILAGQHDPNICVMIDRREEALNRVTAWIFNEEECTAAIMRHRILEFKDGLVINAARWHPHIHSFLALGCSTGEVYLFNYTDSTKKIFAVKDREVTPVVDIQWDRLSSVYLLVAHSNYISLLDTESQSEINVFDKQPAGVTSIAWLDWTAGNFVSSNKKNGTMKVWNVSQKSPIDTFRIGDVGITYVKLGPGTKQCACAHVDGSVSVYHMGKKSLEFKTGNGHTETIFDCKLSPHSPEVFATASYDATVKIWNTSDLSLTKTLQGSDNVLYSVAWSPTGTSIAASTASGSVIVWHIETGKELARYSHHTKPAFCVTWNALHRDTLCSTSSDFSIVIFQVNEEQLLEEVGSKVARGSQKTQQKPVAESKIKMRMMMSCPVFGAHFSPMDGNLLIVGCQDGNVRVFDYLLRTPMICVLKGHTARVFNSLWSPLVDGMIASGSDDKNILIWKLDMEALQGGKSQDDANRQPLTVSPVMTLVGHEMNVRAIQWNPEFKNVLLSGSWDSSIKIWNTDTGECLYSVKGHAADVYSLVVHPDRPFSYLSCSRDSTIRLWELEGPVRVALAQSVWNVSCEPSRSASESNKYVLAGKNSLLLSHKLGQSKTLSVLQTSAVLSIDDRIELAKKFYELFNFYVGNNGSLDVWECALSLLLSQKAAGLPQPLSASMLLRPSSCRIVLARSEIVLDAESDALKGDSVKASARGEHMSERTRNQLREAANLYACVGNYTKFCSIMFELGSYNEALAVAPCVSIDYWKELSLIYANDLAKKSSEMCVPFYVGVGKVESAVDFYLKRQNMKSALIVASKAEANPVSQIPSMRARTPPRTQVVQVGSATRKSAFASEVNNTVSAVLGLSEPKAFVKAVSHSYADILAKSGKPIHAAAQHLSVGGAGDAVKVLVSCGEYELALALAICFQIKDMDEVKCLLAQRLAGQGALQEALEILDSINKENVEKEKGYLINQAFPENDEAPKNYLEKSSLRSLSSWSNLASEMEIMGANGDNIVPLVMSRQFTKAATQGLAFLRNFVRDPLELTLSGKTVLRSLKFVRATELEEKLRASFLMHMMWFCGHEAAERGLWSIAAYMLKKLGQNCKKYPFPISEDQIVFQEMFFSIFGGDPHVVHKLAERVEGKEDNSSSSVVSGLKNLQNLLQNITDKHSLESKQQQPKNRDDPGIGANIYGSSTSLIRDEVVRLGDAMSLPSMMKLKITRPGTGSISLVMGANLPAQYLHHSKRSCISGEVIVGPSVKVDSTMGDEASSEAYASIGEVLGWSRVNPFEPGMSGEWISSKVVPPSM